MCVVPMLSVAVTRANLIRVEPRMNLPPPVPPNWENGMSRLAPGSIRGRFVRNGASTPEGTSSICPAVMAEPSWFLMVR